ncbi:MAG: hypothetical protein KBD46_00135 [Candidatus Levybacteria bacterium]|nr:hypothetical protein [Candidatus Levybacteria bacterium]
MSLSALSQKSVLVIFAYSPTGLGHLRVTDALYEGLPETVSPILLGSQDKAVGALHRFMSIHPITRTLFEWGQTGWMQYVTTFIYEFILHTRTKLLYQQLATILDERLIIPDTIVVVATHFGLAHQLSHIKETIEKKKNIKLLLFVQVTDDSPQPLWYIPGAAMTFVPSHYTKEKLDDFAKLFTFAKLPMTIIPYPLSPSFSTHLTAEKQHKKQEQVHLQSRTQIHVALPIPGAAVGTDFLAKLIPYLHQASDRFVFHIIAKQAQYTNQFLTSMLDHPYVHLHVSPHDRETVNNYEKLYTDHVISLEVTKPSEQTFKALLTPQQTGGSLLLFAHPVGKQEYDNIAFLRRHHLIPNKTVHEMLWEKAEKNVSLDTVFGRELLRVAKTWRGILLPPHSLQSSNFIIWCLREGIFAKMMDYTRQQHSEDTHQDELDDTGVMQFWKTVAAMTEHHL